MARGYVALQALPGWSGNPKASLDDADDILLPFRRDTETDNTNASRRIAIMLGDFNFNGGIDTSNSENAYERPYLLWSAGPDAQFGPDKVQAGTTPQDIKTNSDAAGACDDITNFR